MTYEEYLEKFREKILNGEISDSIPMSKKYFEEFVKPVIVQELRDDVNFRLNYKDIYLRLRKLVMAWPDSEDKERHLKELDSDYEELSKKLNLE